MSDLIERLRFKANADYEFYRAHGRKGAQWSLGEELSWQAADALEARDKTIAELVDLLIVAHVSWQASAPISPQFEQRLDAVLSQAQSKDKAE